jgi:uncharacterized membrane protein YraQ (UPF0718 family)
VVGIFARHSAWLFLGLVGLVYGIAFLADPVLAQDALLAGWGMLHRILPALGLVFLLLLFSNLWLTPERVRRYLGKASGWRGWVAVLVGGMLSVGPVYAWYATLRDLMTKGMRTGLAAAFLYNRGIKLPLLPLLVHYFGWGYTLILIFYMTLFAVISGKLLERVISPQHTVTHKTRSERP